MRIVPKVMILLPCWSEDMSIRSLPPSKAAAAAVSGKRRRMWSGAGEQTRWISGEGRWIHAPTVEREEVWDEPLNWTEEDEESRMQSDYVIQHCAVNTI